MPSRSDSSTGNYPPSRFPSSQSNYSQSSYHGSPRRNPNHQYQNPIQPQQNNSIPNYGNGFQLQQMPNTSNFAALGNNWRGFFGTIVSRDLNIDNLINHAQGFLAQQPSWGQYLPSSNQYQSNLLNPQHIPDVVGGNNIANLMQRAQDFIQPLNPITPIEQRLNLINSLSPAGIDNCINICMQKQDADNHAHLCNITVQNPRDIQNIRALFANVQNMRDIETLLATLLDRQEQLNNPQSTPNNHYPVPFANFGSFGGYAVPPFVQDFPRMNGDPPYNPLGGAAFPPQFNPLNTANRFHSGGGVGASSYQPRTPSVNLYADDIYPRGDWERRHAGDGGNNNTSNYLDERRAEEQRQQEQHAHEMLATQQAQEYARQLEAERLYDQQRRI